jgi:hypothetical protein
LTADVPAPRLARLQNRLKFYNYQIDYRSGKLNGNADALSRFVDSDCENTPIEKDTDIIFNAIRLKTDQMNSEYQ